MGNTKIKFYFRRNISAVAPIAIVDILRQINEAGMSPLIYLVCIQVLKRSDGDYGFVTAFASVGYLLFSYLCGYIGDYLKGRKSFFLSLSLSMISFISIFLCLLLKFDFYYVFLISLLCISFSDTLFLTSQNSRLPEIVGKENLTLGNAVLQLTASAGNFLGPIMIAVCYAGGNLSRALFSLIVINAINMIMVLRLFPVVDETNKVTKKTHDTKALNLWECFRYIFRRKNLVLILAATFLINLAFSMFEVVQILHMVRVWNIQEAYALTISSYASIGGVMGSIAAPFLAKRSYKMAVWLGVAIPSGFAMLLLLPHVKFWLVCLIFMALRFSRSIGAVIRVTIRQLTIEENIRGTITGAIMTITWGVEPFGSMLSGILSQHLGSGFVLAVGAGCLLAASICMIMLVRECKRTSISV